MSEQEAHALVLQRIRSVGIALKIIAEEEFPKLLRDLEEARKGTPDALHEESAVFAARATKVEQELRETRVKLSVAEADLRLAQRERDAALALAEQRKEFIADYQDEIKKAQEGEEYWRQEGNRLCKERDEARAEITRLRRHLGEIP